MEIVRQKNVATYIVFPLVDADGDPVTGQGASADSEIDQWADGAAPTGFADCTNEATELGTTGVYYLSLTQAEMNEDYIVIKTSSSGAKTQVILIRTITGDPLLLATTTSGRLIEIDASNRVNVGAVMGTVQTAGDIIGDTNDIQARLPAALVSGRIDASVGAMAANVLTASAIADGALTAAKAAAGFFDAVWSVATRTLTGFSTSLALSVWDVLESAIVTASTIGLKVKTNLDAAMTSRSSHSAADVWAVGTRALTDKAGFSLAADQSAVTVGTVNALGTQAKADVNAEVVDALNVDTYAEIGQETPAATQTIRKMLGFLYKAWRNRSNQTSTLYQLFNDDATTVGQKATVSDDATTFEKGEIATGP